MRRLAVILAALWLAACARDPLDQLAVGESGRVAEVRSGDTFVLENGMVVRLAGIDAPNTGRPYADKAKEALEALAEGQDVQLLYGGRRRDAYGRALAHVRLKKGQVWLQRRLLEDGAAWVRTYPDNRALAAPMMGAEAKAREARKGLWAAPDNPVRLPIEARNETGFQIVEGRVTSVSQKYDKQIIALDGTMTAELPARWAGDFRAAQVEPAALKGRLVRLRGYVGRGGALRLDHPEQVETLREPK